MSAQYRTNLRLAEGGRIVIPSEARHRLGLKVGAEVIMTVEGDRATLISAKAARVRARQRVRRYIDPGADLSAELSAERKRQACDE